MRYGFYLSLHGLVVAVFTLKGATMPFVALCLPCLNGAGCKAAKLQLASPGSAQQAACRQEAACKWPLQCFARRRDALHGLCWSHLSKLYAQHRNTSSSSGSKMWAHRRAVIPSPGFPCLPAGLGAWASAAGTLHRHSTGPV